VDVEARRDGRLDRVEEPAELGRAVARQAAADNGSRLDVEGGE
jgi:hypothetical protein